MRFRVVLLSAVLAVGMASYAPAVGAQTPTKDSLVVTGTTADPLGLGQYFDSIAIRASSGPSGEGPSGRAFFIVSPFGLRVGSQTSDNVTCLSVRGNEATMVFSDEGLGTQVVEAVDNGPPESGLDRFIAVVEARSPSDCSPFTALAPWQLIRGDVAIDDAPPFPTSKDQCKNGGWRTYGVFKNQGQCVAFVERGPKG